MSEADELAMAVVRLVNQVSHWTPPRWAASSVSASGPTKAEISKAEIMYGLVQRIADLAADVEGQPHRVVPRLDTDLALPDQLRVVTADLVAAGPDGAVLRRAVELVAETRLDLGR